MAMMVARSGRRSWGLFRLHKPSCLSSREFFLQLLPSSSHTPPSIATPSHPQFISALHTEPPQWLPLLDPSALPAWPPALSSPLASRPPASSRPRVSILASLSIHEALKLHHAAIDTFPRSPRPRPGAQEQPRHEQRRAQRLQEQRRPQPRPEPRHRR